MSTGSTAVAVPPGCDSIKMESTGLEIRARSGVVQVPDAYMGELGASNAVKNGILAKGRSYRLGTQAGRVCSALCCLTIWQAWTKECHRCGAPTVTESEGAALRSPCHDTIRTK